MVEPGWDRIQPSRLIDPELLGGAPQNAGKKTFAGEGREPESAWMGTAGQWMMWMWQKSPPSAPRVVRRGRDPDFATTTMVVLMNL